MAVNKIKETEDRRSFEELMARLEEIVRMLERGNAPLEESLALFEEGTDLIRRCSGLLDNAEQKVVMLRKGGDGSPEELDFPAMEEI